MRRLLVGYDGSAAARRALDRAIAEARESSAAITVLFVFEVPLDLDVPRNFGTLDDISDREGAALSPPPDVIDRLVEARDLLAHAGIEADLLWAAGQPAQEIVETAARIRADAIVIGEHHHGVLAGLFGSDVDAEVKQRAGCDVILA